MCHCYGTCKCIVSLELSDVERQAITLARAAGPRTSPLSPKLCKRTCQRAGGSNSPFLSLVFFTQSFVLLDHRSTCEINTRHRSPPVRPLTSTPPNMERIRVSKVGRHTNLESRHASRAKYGRSKMCTSTVEASASAARCTSCPTTSSSATCLASPQMRPPMRSRRGRKKYGSRIP
jgi:hypothetical protein